MVYLSLDSTNENNHTSFMEVTVQPSSVADDHDIEALFPEAREVERHRRLRYFGIASLVVAVVALVVVSIVAGGAGSRHVKVPSKARAAPFYGTPLLTTATLGPGTQIDSVSMVSPQTGYVTAVSKSHRDAPVFYLAKTTSGGRTWRLVGPTPFVTSSEPKYDLAPSVDFVSARVGYMFESGLTPIYVTVNGGLSWHRLIVKGGLESLVATGSRAAVVSNTCTNPKGSPWLCRDVLQLYRLGAVTPYRARLLPTFGQKESGDTLLAMSSKSLVMAQGPHESLVRSINLGATWVPIETPCRGVDIGGQQVTATSPNVFSLICFSYYGMGWSGAMFYRTSDAGRRWSVVASSTPSIHDALHRDEVPGDQVIRVDLRMLLS